MNAGNTGVGTTLMGVQSVTGWMVDNTDPLNPIINAATWLDVLTNGADAAGTSLIGLKLLSGQAGVDLKLQADANQGVWIVSDGGNFFLKIDDLGELTTDLVQFNITAAAGFEIYDGGGNRSVTIDNTTIQLFFGDVDGAGNNTIFSIDDVNELVTIQTTGIIGKFDSANVVMDITGVGAAFSVNSNQGVTETLAAAIAANRNVVGGIIVP